MSAPPADENAASAEMTRLNGAFTVATMAAEKKLVATQICGLAVLFPALNERATSAAQWLLRNTERTGA